MSSGNAEEKPEPHPGTESSAPGWAGVVSLFEGKKTYLVTAAAAIYVFGSSLGWWPLDDRILALLGFGGIAALRQSILLKK